MTPSEWLRDAIATMPARDDAAHDAVADRAANILRPSGALASLVWAGGTRATGVTDMTLPDLAWGPSGASGGWPRARDQREISAGSGRLRYSSR